MKNPTKYVAFVAWAMLLLLAACGGKSKQGPCSVEVYYPNAEFTEVKLIDPTGHMIDSTLTIRNDSIRFSRNDTARMPYVAVLMLTNPTDSINFVSMPVVIEAGTVKLELTDRISLSGTDDNKKLFEFQKAKNTFTRQYDEKMNPEHDVQKLKADYSKFYSDQAILNKDNVVGEYIFDTYRSIMTLDDENRVKEWIKR
ncbi:MAG: hypothetical protein K2L22_03800 [Muribaculaceae bacterium]|nr:hypothetical protein [Muribaculaceae bacterium]